MKNPLILRVDLSAWEAKSVEQMSDWPALSSALCFIAALTIDTGGSVCLVHTFPHTPRRTTKYGWFPALECWQASPFQLFGAQRVSHQLFLAKELRDVRACSPKGWGAVVSDKIMNRPMVHDLSRNCQNLAVTAASLNGFQTFTPPPHHTYT